jgi:thioredoxin 1
MNKVIKFSADWCGPCKAMKPQFDKFHNSLKESGVEMVDLDVDQNHEEASKYGVRSIPFTVFIKDDMVAKSLVGMQTTKQLTEAFNEVYTKN